MRLKTSSLSARQTLGPESYLPEAFMVRRSVPWGTPSQHGLYFVAYGRSLDAFERVLTRMAGIEDGMRDALFSFTHPVTGGYYWSSGS